MKYDSATIDASYESETVTIDLEDMRDRDELIAKVWEPFPADDEDDRDELPPGWTFQNPQGFAVHLFDYPHGKRESDTAQCEPTASFDELLEAWSNERDDDRREAMGEYLDDMGANDLSDFDEAYQGQYASGAAFAEQFADDMGAVDEKNASWVCIDWERTWDRSLRHDYHITESGHVFRNL